MNQVFHEGSALKIIVDGDEGPVGPEGPAGNVAATLAILKAAPITNDTMIYDHATFKWSTADAPYTADDINIIQSDDHALSVGAWIRLSASNIQTTSGTVQTALDALAGSNVTTEATTARTLTAADIGKIISCTAATAVTITVPAGLGATFYCSIAQIGAGQVTISAGSGASLANADAQYATQARYVRLTLWASSADNLVLEGRTA